jgi:phosphomevalonate kinase
MIHVSAPGKLFLSGEWAVLEVGNPGIVTAVNKRIHAEVEEADRFVVTIDDFGIKDLGAVFDGKELVWERKLSDDETAHTQFIKGAIESVGQYLGSGELKSFRMRSWGDQSQIEIDGQIKKVGFGSSAASVVATVTALLKLHGHEIESKEAKDRIYKLSAIAHYFIQGKVGSAFDVAASTYGGVFVYQRFDPRWLMQKMESGASVKEMVDQEWPSFRVEQLEIPEGFELLIGWTRESASTSVMVKQLNAWAEDNQEEYNKIYDKIADLVKEIIPAWKAKDRERILELARKNEEYLRELGQASGVNIETQELRELSDIANRNRAAGKLSGAGGGDCGIALSFDKEITEKVKNEWINHGLYIVDAMVDHKGVME